MFPSDPNAPFVLLDDNRDGQHTEPSLLFTEPKDIICAKTLDDVPAALEAIDTAHKSGLHTAGWVAYETAAVFEPKVKAAIRYWPQEPLIWMMVCRDFVEVEASQLNDVIAEKTRWAESELFFTSKPIGRDEYRGHIDVIKDYIEAGDIYQANYTFPRRCRVDGSPLDLYRKLRSAQPVEYGAYIHTGEHTVMSFSPELFVKRRGASLKTRPMKGTTARHRNLVEDREAAIALSADPKSRAENLMIVDLLRNDLSRVAVQGSVNVSDLFTIETYSTLHQMTSGIEAQCDAGLKPTDLLSALFPCGSVTGAPKIRAMEIIAERETAPRGIYCGAIGHFSPEEIGRNATWTLNVPIRTLVFDADGIGTLAIGSGIVADSEPLAEYDECLLKSLFAETTAAEPFHLIETMRCEAGKIDLLERHLDRLENSALKLSMPFNRATVGQDLRSTCPEDGLHRMRATLSKTGELHITTSPFDAGPTTGLRVAIAEETLKSGDFWQRHKSSHRALYDAASKAAAAAGLADILFLNEQSELVEGATNCLFLQTGDGWVTPPISSGALPSVLKASMFDDPKIEIIEKKISIQDVAEGRLFIGNALRGLRRVKVVEDHFPIRPDSDS